MNKIELCLQIAIRAHAGQLDRNGEPYILHPLAVGLMGHTDEERMTGFLHDVIEDTSTTIADLEQAGVPRGVTGAVEVLTHIPSSDQPLTEAERSEAYLSYIRQIIRSANPIALQVKRNDLRHNLQRANSNEHWQRKYQTALALVEQAIEDCSKVCRYEPPVGTDFAVFACGCFWGVQHRFARQKGVLSTTVGYTGGKEQMPTYAEVRDQRTGHVEAVAVTYDPKETDYRKLCQFFFEIHDPAQTDGQGEDIGSQYLSKIFYVDEKQRCTAEAVMADLRSRGYEVNTALLPLDTFWQAEAYHQHYYDHTGGEPYCHIWEKKF